MARALSRCAIALCTTAASLHALAATPATMTARDRALCRAVPAKPFAPARVSAANDDELMRLVKTSGDSAAIRRALKKADVNEWRGPAQTTLLATAASIGNLNAMRALIARGAQANQVTGNGETPLEYAILGGQAAAACLLLQRGATFPKPQDKSYLIPAAALANDPAAAVTLVDLLSGHGFDLNAQVNGDTALQIAAELGNTALTKLLTARGAHALRPDTGSAPAGAIPSHASAAPAGHKAPSASVAAPIPNRCPHDPTEEPIDFSSEAAMRQSIDAQFKNKGMAAPRIVQALGQSRHAALKQLLAEGENPNVCVFGSSILALSVASGDLETVRLLLSSEAKPDEPAEADGTTALMTALNTGRYDIARVLLGQGADARATTDDGTTALHQLAIGSWRQDSPESVREQQSLADELVAKGISVNAETRAGSTALMSAVAAGDSELVARLLNLGADVRVRSRQGHTALSLAERKRRDDMVTLLRSFGATH